MKAACDKLTAESHKEMDDWTVGLVSRLEAGKRELENAQALVRANASSKAEAGMLTSKSSTSTATATATSTAIATAKASTTPNVTNVTTPLLIHSHTPPSLPPPLQRFLLEGSSDVAPPASMFRHSHSHSHNTSAEPMNDMETKKMMIVRSDENENMDSRRAFETLRALF